MKTSNLWIVSLFIVFAGFVGLETHIPVALLEILTGIFSTFSFYTIIFVAVLLPIPFLAPNLAETIFARYQKNVVSC